MCAGERGRREGSEVIDSIHSFASAVNGRRYEFAVDVPEGMGRTALLFVHTMVASTNVGEYAIATPQGWHELGVATGTTTNRRYVAGAWSMPEPSSGRQLVVIETSRPVAGVVAFWCLSEAAPLRAVAQAGNAQALEAAGPFAAPVVFAAQARQGAAEIGTDTGQVLSSLSAAPEDTSQEVAAALMLAGPSEVVRAQAQGGRLALLLAVELAVEEEPPPPPPPPPVRIHEFSVIVRELGPGQSYEVRHVRPTEMVMGAAGIDWGQTPYTSHILAVPEEPAAPE